MSRIAAIQVYRADLPLLRRLEHASASEPLLEEVFLWLRTTAGGWGLVEIRGNGAYATGTDTATLVREISHRVVGGSGPMQSLASPRGRKTDERRAHPAPR